MRKFVCAAAFVLIAAGTAGCLAARQEIDPAMIPASDARSVIAATVLAADPDGAVNEIYETLGNSPSLTEITGETIEEVFGITLQEANSFVAFTSDARNGLCDVAIIEPAPDKAGDVREALNQYSDRRAASFKNYDILGAFAIASGSLVYSQGDYIIMLMLPDNDAAMDIIDRYIPK